MHKNPFGALKVHDSDDEDGGHKTRTNPPHHAVHKPTSAKPAQGQAPGHTPGAFGKTDKTKVREGPKAKGVSAEPHPLDRRSGTGRGKEMTKGGHGKNNWGDHRDELRRGDEETKVEGQTGAEGENPEVKVVEPPKPTLEEYYAKLGLKATEAPSNAPKTTYQLFHGQNRKPEVDDHKEVAKKTYVQSGPLHGAKSEFHDLLGFNSEEVQQERRRPYKKREEGEHKGEHKEGEEASPKERRGARGGYRGGDKRQGEQREQKGEAKEGEETSPKERRGGRGGYKGGEHREHHGGRQEKKPAAAPELKEDNFPALA